MVLPRAAYIARQSSFSRRQCDPRRWVAYQGLMPNIRQASSKIAMARTINPAIILTCARLTKQAILHTSASFQSIFVTFTRLTSPKYREIVIRRTGFTVVRSFLTYTVFTEKAVVRVKASASDFH
jgi:hypothetical protein